MAGVYGYSGVNMSLSVFFNNLLSSPAFQNAFWVFVGIVAGSLIQFLFHYLVLRSQKANARRLLGAEVSLNRVELEAFEKQVERKKGKFSSGQADDFDFLFDMSGFNYRMVDPLINSGHFHDILGPEGVKMYFRFMNDLNVNAAGHLNTILTEKHHDNSSISFLDWLIDVKVQEWSGTLDYIEKRTQQ